MAPDLTKITAALNAYPWVAGALTARGSATVEYCAIGLLLRYSGVPQREIECAGSALVVWERYRELLGSEYGIGDFGTVRAIIMANDYSATHEEAIDQVQRVLTGEIEPDARRRALRTPQTLDAFTVEDDDGGCCPALLA